MVMKLVSPPDLRTPLAVLTQHACASTFHHSGLNTSCVYRTSTPAASAAPGAATSRKGKTSTAAKEENAAQPRLTAFFGSKPKQQQQGQHPTEVAAFRKSSNSSGGGARKMRSTGITSESELGLKQQRQQEGNDVLSLAVEEEQPSLLKRIPVRDIWRRLYNCRENTKISS